MTKHVSAHIEFTQRSNFEKKKNSKSRGKKSDDEV